MRYIGFIFALCLSIQAIASNTITLSSVSGTPQTEVEVVVSLDNTDAITALELNIPLGEHLSYVDGSTVLASSRSNGHLLTATQVQHELRICVYSLNLSALQGNSGELLSFRLKLGNEPATYTLTPSVILSDARGQSLDSDVQSGQVSILAPKLEILNPQIDYGHIPIRETYTQDLQLYNAGNLPLIIEDIVVNDPAFTPAQTALTIEVGEVAYTTIHYAPTVRGAIQKEVVVTSNAINGEQMGTIVADPFSVNELHVVGGSGIADNAVTISLKMNNMEPIVGMQCTFVLPEQLEYVAGSLSANSSRSNGHQALASVKKFVEKENQWYDSKGDTLVLMLYSMANQPLNGNDGEIATFQVRLNGNSGSYDLTPRDVVLTNATAENMVSATYEGWVEIQSPQFSGDDYLSFGDWAITDDIVVNYVVRNDGDAPLEIERVTFLAQGYRVVSTMPLQINPWEESTMQIAYDPAAEGDFSTTMNIYTNDPSTRMKAVAVSGHVYEPNTLSVDGERMQDGSYQLAISLDNYTNIVGVQYDIHWRSDMTTSQAAFTPTARLQNHTYAIMPIGKNTYRVLIYSLSNTPITGKEGELHQLLFTPQGDVDYCGDVLTIDNIVLSNANGTDKVSQSTVLHHLPTTQYSEQTITACDQYVYNNKVYQSSGTYIDTLQTVGGCDSIVTTYLTINHSEREEYYETVCEEFWWHDNRYTESGDYTYHTTAWNGCERVEILHLTINRSEREEYYETACDEFYWDHNGETYYESGDYEYYTTTEQGCERVEVLHLTINRSEREEYYETACDEYYWDHNGETYYESGDYEYYTTTEQGCERLEVLHLTINRSEREEYRLTTCMQYEWHGQIYTESGDYEYHTTTEQGCERVEVLHLTISDREQEEFYETACEEYYWNGQTYTESGDYTFNTTSSSGCDRTEVLHLTIYKRDTVHYYETACNEYYWDHNWQYYYDSGDYEHYTTNEHGCERVEILHLTIHHSEHQDYYENACDAYEWHGETYTQSGNYEYRTTLENGCERVEVLHLTIYNSQYEEYWETACDEYYWNGEIYTESGDYTFNTTSSSGCDRTEVLHLTIYKRDTVHYYETACNEYYWDHNWQYYYDSGDYEHYTTNEHGCERVEILHLTIHHSEREEYYVTTCNQYEWHGQVYTEPGDYEYYTTTEYGCERVEVLHLSFSDREYEEYYETACDQYEWHGEVYTESGDYTFNTISSSGCERTEVLQLTIFYSEHEEYNITACDSYEWNGETYSESGDYEYRTTIEETTEKLYVGYNAQNDPIIGLVPPRGISKFTVDGYITQGAGTCFVGTGTPADEVADEADLRIFDAGCFYYDRMSGRNSCFFYDYREPFNIEFGNYYAKNLETGEYYFNEGNNVYEYSNTEYPLTLFHNDYGKIHKVQFFDNNNLLWADINAVIEGGVPMITIDYYNQDGSIYHTQQFTENLHAETKTITEQGCERVEVLHLTINRSEREEYWETACDAYEWHGNTYTESGDYEHYTTTEHGCERVEVLHLTINRSEREEYYEYACDSYEWHGQVYTESGTYEYHTTTDQGCERLEVLYLTIYNSQYEEYWETACDEYWWNGNQYTESGDYTYSFVIADWGSGYCERTEVLHLTINHREREEYWATACDEYYWDRNGNTYYDSGDYEHYTTTEQGCERVEVLHLTINRSEREEYWETACDEYYWDHNGETYYESGDYEYYTTTDQGCERVEVLHLTINHSERQEYSVTACDQYEWHGEIYSESGTYEYHTTTEQGCERVEVLYLTISDREHEEYYETACNEFYWNHNGQTYYESGDYIFNTTAANGCERTEVLHLTINHSEHQEYYENACDAYEWHGNTYTESGDYEYRTTLENGCERVEVLHLTIYNSQYEEYWETACDEYWWNGNQYTESGDYTYSYPLYNWGTGTCDRTEVLHLTINKRDTVHYYETACDEYWWDPYGLYYNTSGDYENYTTNEHGCERVEILHLTINHSEREEYWENACDAYEWHGNTYTESGDYEYRTTLENGCERVEVLHLTIYNSQYEEYWETACDEYYWWNGERYTESGDYTYSYPLYNWGTGTCDRTEVLHLTINKRDTVHYYETACDEYWWDPYGLYYNTSGDYEYYTTNEYGCERVEVLHLTINRSEHQDYYENACDAYEWHGNTYTESGDYEYRTTLENGCERVEVLHLTIYNSQYEEYWETACDEYYWWNGERYTESGDYTYSYPLYNWGTGTCDRTEVLHLTINKRDTVHYYETACDAYEWHGQYYNISGDYENYTTNEYGCERVEILHLTINYSEYEEYWETDCDAYEWYGNTYTKSGDYEYHTTTEQGCERVEMLHLTINHSQYEEYNITTCEQYEWHGETYTESGDYEYRTTLENGCERVEVLHLTLSDSEHEEYNITACDSYEWHGETYTESGDYEYRTTIEETTEKLYVGYDAQNDPIIGLVPPRGVSKFTVDGYITEEYGACFVGTGTPVDEEADNSDLRIFGAGCLFFDRMSGRSACFFDDYRNPFNIEFGNFYAKNLETSEYYFNEGNNVYEYSNTEYPLTLFYNDYGKIHKVQFFDNNNLLWADINAVIEGGVPMITIDYYNPDGSIYHTQQFTENLHAETKIITEQGCERVEILHLTIKHSEREEYYETACDAYEWHGNTYYDSGDYEHYTTTEHGCERVEVLHLTINRSEREEYWETACDSYEWYGQVYTASGDYEYRTTTEQGCERIEVLHLTINRSEREEYWETACDEYWWHGNTYTESGDYEYYTTTDQGCERVEVLHLTILPDATTESEELALCPSELPYEWYGQSITEAGTYSAAEQYAGMDCDSVIHELTLNVYVQTLPATVTLPIVRTGEAIDVTIPTAEIQAHIAAETWYAPNALVAWYIMENSDWASLTNEPVAVGIEEVTLKYAVETDCGIAESDKMVIAVETTGLENIPTDVMGVYKVLRDNKIFIIRGGKAYSIMGHLVGDKSVINPVVTIQ